MEEKISQNKGQGAHILHAAAFEFLGPEERGVQERALCFTCLAPGMLPPSQGQTQSCPNWATALFLEAQCKPHQGTDPCKNHLPSAPVSFIL